MQHWPPKPPEAPLAVDSQAGVITTRVLPPEEWTRLVDFEPFRSTGLPDRPDLWRIGVVERDGQIVAFSALFTTVHWDLFHVVPAERGNPAVFRALLERGAETMIEHQIAVVHTTVPAGQPELEAMLERFGFTRTEGALYYLQRSS